MMFSCLEKEGKNEGEEEEEGKEKGIFKLVKIKQIFLRQNQWLKYIKICVMKHLNFLITFLTWLRKKKKKNPQSTEKKTSRKRNV